RLVAENRSLRDQAQRAEMRPTTPLGFADDRALTEARAEAVRAIQDARTEADRIVRAAATEAARLRAEAVAAARNGPARAEAAAGGLAVSPAGHGPPREFIH